MIDKKKANALIRYRDLLMNIKPFCNRPPTARIIAKIGYETKRIEFGYLQNKSNLNLGFKIFEIETPN